MCTDLRKHMAYFYSKLLFIRFELSPKNTHPTMQGVESSLVVDGIVQCENKFSYVKEGGG